MVLRSLELGGPPLGKVCWVMLVLCCTAVTWTAYPSAYAAWPGSEETAPSGLVRKCLAVRPGKAADVAASVKHFPSVIDVDFLRHLLFYNLL